MQLDLPFRDEPLAGAVPVPIPPDGTFSRSGAGSPAADGDSDSGGAGALQPIVFVRRRRARRYVLRVDEHGTIRVTIPRGGSRREATEFVARHRAWIARQRARRDASAIPALDRDVLRRRALAELPPRLLELAGRHGLRVSRISVRDQRTRWGSCGPNGHICLNWRLVCLPGWVQDYVLIHELMHLRRMDHSPAYWALVAAACPDYQAARLWLREQGRRYR